MQAHVKIEGPVLEVTLNNVTLADRGRVCNIELALLRAYQGHDAHPWYWKNDTAVVSFVRFNSNHKTAEVARKVLEGFGL